MGLTMAGERRCESAGELDEEKLSAHRKREVFDSEEDRKLPLPQHLQHRPPNMLHPPPGVVAQVGRKVGKDSQEGKETAALGFSISGLNLDSNCEPGAS